MTFLALWSLRSGGTIVSGLLLSLLLRHRSAALRSVVLRIILAAAWILPLTILIAPRIVVPLPAETTTSLSPFGSGQRKGLGNEVSVAPPVRSTPGWSFERESSSPISPFRIVHREPFKTASYDLWSLVLLVWLSGTGLLSFRWIVGLARLRRLAHRGESFDEDPSVLRADVSVPMTFGRTILLPREAADWPAVRCQAAILHEHAHLRRHDWVWQTLAAAFAALHWPNPAAWLLNRLLRDAAEAAADDEALAHMAPSDYARELLAVAARARVVGPALTMARRGGIKDRVVAVLTKNRDRSRPTRRAMVGLGVLALASSVTLAGIVVKDAKPEHKGGNDMRLVDVREIGPRPSARWDARGFPVATPAEVAEDPRLTLGLAPKGVRRVDVRFAADGFLESDAPEETSLQDHFWITADKPAKILTYGSAHKNGQPAESPNDGALDLVLDAPLDMARARLHVRRARGAYHVAKLPNVVFAATPDTITWPEGSFPGATVSFKFPEALENVDCRVVVVTAKGRLPVRDNEYDYADDKLSIPKAVHVPCDSPAQVQAVEFEVRDYATATIDVPLRPNAPVVTPRTAESSHTIELVRLSDEKGAWLPDGTPAKPLGTIRSRFPAKPGERKLTLAFRVHGATWSNPSLLVNVGEGYATVADWNGFMPVTGKADERIGIATFNVPEALQTSPVTVVVEANPLRTDADQEPGTKPGQARIERIKEERGNDGKTWTEYRIALDGVAPLDPSREIDLSLLDGDGAFIPLIVDINATAAKPYYTVVAQSGVPVARVVLRSRAVDRARFAGVHLRPNP